MRPDSGSLGFDNLAVISPIPGGTAYQRSLYRQQKKGLKMVKEKVDRNKLIITFYNEGKTNREILAGLQEAGFSDLGSIASMKMQISRLRKAGKIPKERPGIDKTTKREVEKSRSPQIKESRNRQVEQSRKLQDKGIGKYKPVTFRISEQTEWQLKSLAVSRREQVSKLVREILNDYLSRNREVEK